MKFQSVPASPIHYQFDPVQTTKVSVHGSINMLGLAKRVKAKVLQASTSEVYGDPTVHPQKEDYWGNVNPIGLRSCYDEGKRCAETLFFDYRRQHRLPIKVARIFNTYGPGMHPNDGRVVSPAVHGANSACPMMLGPPMSRASRHTTAAIPPPALQPHTASCPGLHPSAWALSATHRTAAMASSTAAGNRCSGAWR